MALVAEQRPELLGWGRPVGGAVEQPSLDTGKPNARPTSRRRMPSTSRRTIRMLPRKTERTRLAGPGTATIQLGSVIHLAAPK
jgi:hypothetical protein